MGSCSGIVVLDGSTCPKRRGFGGFLPIGLNGVLNVFLKQKCIRFVREKLTVFPYEQYINGIVNFILLSEHICYEVKVGIYDTFAQM